MKVHIDKPAHDRLWGFITALDDEVGGFGYAFLGDDGDLYITDVFLVDQVVSSSEVDFGDGTGIAQAVERAAADGVLGEPGFMWLSWHSHHRMDAFWSNTDEDCIKKYGVTGIPHLLSFVGCHDRKYRLRYDAFSVEHHGVTIGQVSQDKLTMIAPGDAELAAEIARHVKKRVYPAPGSKVKKAKEPGAKLERALEKRAGYDNGYTIGSNEGDELFWIDEDEAWAQYERACQLSATQEVS